MRIDGVRSFLRTLFRARTLDRDLDDELQSAIDLLTARYTAAGMAAVDAERRARIELGGVQQVKERTRDARIGIAWETLLLDLRHAGRTIGKSPGYAAAVVLTLALAIGANSAIFTAVKAVLIEPLPYGDPDRLVFIWSDLTAAGYPRAPLAGPELKDLRDRATLFEGFGAIWTNVATISDPQDPEQLRIGLVTPDFFPVLGAPAALGRTFQDTDWVKGAPPSILLSWELFERRYGGDAALIGRRIPINGVATTVVGVMPKDFRLWLPADANVPDDLQAWRLLGPNTYNGLRGQQFLRVIGRLRAGVEVAAANQEVAAIGHQIGREIAHYAAGPPEFSAVALHADTVREIRGAMLALFGGVTLLLVLACVNVANLMVARAVSRRREHAMRAALGASRWRLARSCALEGVMLALIGGAGGLWLATFGLRLLLLLRPETLKRLDGITIDTDVLAFTAIVAVGWGLLLSLAPIAEILRIEMVGAINSATPVSARGATAGRFETRLRKALVVTQIAAGLVLVISAGLLLQGFARLRSVDLGFTPEPAIAFKMAPAFARYPSLSAVNTFVRQLQDELRQLPGVHAVGCTSHLPYDNLPNWSTPYLRTDAPPGQPGRDADARTVSPGYFETMGVHLLDGRFFNDSDEDGKAPVAIVDERLAALAWPGEGAIGKQLRTDPTASGNAKAIVTIVGVVRHLRHRTPQREVREQMYFPQRQVPRAPLSVVVRGDMNAGIVEAIRETVRRLDPQLPIYDVHSLRDDLRRAQAVPRFTMILASIFAMLALVLAAIGVYGIVAYAVAQRRQEIAVRMALGANRPRVLQLVVREAMTLLVAGAMLGLVGARVAGGAIQTQLYEISPFDATTYFAAVIVMVVVVVLASTIPAARATCVRALDSLRVN